MHVGDLYGETTWRGVFGDLELNMEHAVVRVPDHKDPTFNISVSRIIIVFEIEELL